MTAGDHPCAACFIVERIKGQKRIDDKRWVRVLDRVVVVAMQCPNAFAWLNVLDHGGAELGALFWAVVRCATMRVQDAVDDCRDSCVRGNVVELASFREKALAHSPVYLCAVQTLRRDRVEQFFRILLRFDKARWRDDFWDDRITHVLNFLDGLIHCIHPLLRILPKADVTSEGVWLDRQHACK